LCSRSARSSAEKVCAKMRRPATGARSVQNERKAGGCKTRGGRIVLHKKCGRENNELWSGELVLIYTHPDSSCSRGFRPPSFCSYHPVTSNYRRAVETS